MQPSMPRKESSSSTVDPDYKLSCPFDRLDSACNGGFLAIVLLVELVLYAIEK